MLSFDPEDGGNEDDEPSSSQKKSKKRKKHSSKQRKKRGGGLGYGGLGMAPMDASDGSSSEGERKKPQEMNEKDDDDDRGGSYYDKAALEKLRLEQKRSTFLKDDTTKIEPAVVASVANEIVGATKQEDKEDSAEEEEFIPLSGGNTKTSSSRVADPLVLTGEEAMAYARREEEDDANVDFDHGLQSPPTPPPSCGVDNEKAVTGKVKSMDINADIMDIDDPSEEVEEGNRRWEDTMARRAGVLNGRSRPQQRDNSSSSLSQIRTSLQPTISNLENVYSDLESSIHRHESTLSSTRDELTKHQSTLQKHGQALEYYQGLREDLATWMGALRELNGMVEKVEEAKRQLEAEMSWRRLERFWEWGKDCTEVLEKQGLLETKVVGEDCYLDGVNFNNAPVQEVDEFGRDLSSMASISRVKRWNQRRKSCIRRLLGVHTDSGDLENPFQQSIVCSNEDNVDSGEFGERKQRYEALTKAVAIIPDLVKDDYLSISNLCTLFFNWEREYPEDYATCYAEMSLVQMISVLVRLEMCERWNVLDICVDPSSTPCLETSDFKWFHNLKLDDSRRDINGEVGEKRKAKPKCILLEVVQKQIVGRLFNSFSLDDGKDGNKQQEIYDPFSVTQTKHMCSMLTSLLKYFSSCSEENSKAICGETAGKILNSLLSLVKYCVGRMVVPIGDASKISLTRNQFAMGGVSRELDGETADAIAYASVIQVKALCTLAKNILGQWYPILNREMCNQQQDEVASLVQFVFEDLVSIRILPTLHSLHVITSGDNGSDKKYSEISKLFINEILDTMQGEELLENDRWMLMAAPLRVLAKQWDDNCP
eukprot:CAMPEP_0201670902 /NCGR_PEP_ID=MMETSP0494-20130426/28086_1 /ASSEMBLY_ACC=CAM_ASM_000839 /TAXON_ID=420259 /ORGANISM="Thalassiosira gravida, Strain GMp14c1" /LENGTH=823 /DNA_ID=CAMNT_0048152083 /DNA_START=14 /DNA_END=2485 /DNA_ORIENTATION=-